MPDLEVDNKIRTTHEHIYKRSSVAIGLWLMEILLGRADLWVMISDTGLCPQSDGNFFLRHEKCIIEVCHGER
jgi:hypothetical protein